MVKMNARRRRTRGALLGVGLALGLAAPASAQWFGGFEPERPIPPQGIARMLAARGFTDISRPRFDGEVYTVEGTNRLGDRVRLTIDAFDGDIVGRTRFARAGEPFGAAPIPPRDVGRGPAASEEPVAAREPFGPAEPPRASGPQPEPPARKQAATPRPARASEAKPAQARVSPPAPAPVAAAPKPQAPNAGKPAAVAARSATPVRIIGGVTPLDPNQPTAARQAAAEPPASPEAPPL